MKGLDPYPLLKTVFEALLLVEKGLSERSAVARVAAADPGLTVRRREALNLVMEILAKRDIFDLAFESSLGRKPQDRRELAIGRLAAYLVLSSPDSSLGPEVVESLRALSPILFRPFLENLFGLLPLVDIQQILEREPDSGRVALATHHPRWWVEYCFRLFGRSEAISLLSAAPRPRYVRVNPLRNRGRMGIPAKAIGLRDGLTPVESVPGVFAISNRTLESKMSPFFSEGLFQVQDLASFLAVKAVDPGPGEKVLDLCAAPGAKTGTLAQLMKNRGMIVSVDYSPVRMRSWRNEVSRLGVKLAEAVVEDCTRLGIHRMFDLALVDPPCTGTGVFDRNPRMKWHFGPTTIERYSRLQSRMLEASAGLVEPEGRILYCTCSLTVEENESVVAGFLQAHPDFETRPVLKGLGSPGLRGMADCRRFYPHRDRMAGYFIARLERSN